VLKKIIKSVGRRRWEHDDPKIRAKAASELDPEARESEAILLRLASDDPDLDVRRAALRRLSRPEVLLPFICADDVAVATTAAERLGELLEPPLPQALIETAEVADALAAHATREPVALAALERLDAPKTLAELATHATLARVRHAAVERLRDEASLTAVEKQTRASDKTVHRRAREQLDRLKALRHTMSESHEKLEHLAESARKLAEATPDPMYARRIDALEAQWDAACASLLDAADKAREFGLVAEPIEPLQARFAADISRAREPLTVADAAPPREAPPDNARPETPTTAQPSEPEIFERAVASLDAVRERLAVDAGALAGAARCLDEEQARWLAASDHEPPPASLSEKFHETCHTLKELMEANERLGALESELEELLARAAPELGEPREAEDYQRIWGQQHDEREHARRLAAILKKVSWPSEFAAPGLLTQAHARSEAFDKFDEDTHALHETLRERLREVLDRLQESVDAGSLRSATGSQGEAKRILRSLPHGSARGLQRRFTALTGRVQELKDWETFATAPKREALCEEMEALVESTLTPEVRAGRIKELREAWRALGPPVSAKDRRLLGRFNEAAEKAFAPCRAYFEEQSELRRWNLDNRMKICAELEHFLRDNDWDHPDWRAVDQILRTAQNEWRKFSPVDRTRGRDVNDRFRKVMDELRGRLREEWNRNVERKEAIIREAEEARDNQPVQTAVETLKELQRHWQSVGVTPRRKDQKLWKAFRDVCDQVFSARDSERTAHREALAGQTREGESICEELEHLIDRRAESASNEHLQDTRRRFNQLELPREAATRLQTRFDRAAKAYRGLLNEAARERERAQLRRVLTLEQILAENEARAIAGDVPDADALQSAVPLSELPEDMEGALGPRLNALLESIASNDTQLLSKLAEDAFDARRRIVIKLEIAAGIDSPEADQPLRLEQQVARLSRGMGSRINHEESAEELIAAWCSAGPDIPERSGELRERFKQALDELLGAAA
jgi:exonuclease SbcC